MYKIIDLQLEKNEGDNYLLTGGIEHPEEVTMKLESIENDEAQKQVVISYYAEESKDSSVMFAIHQPLDRPEWADKAVVVAKGVDRRKVDEDSVIFD